MRNSYDTVTLAVLIRRLGFEFASDELKDKLKAVKMAVLSNATALFLVPDFNFSFTILKVGFPNHGLSL